MNSLFESSYLSIMSQQNDKLREENQQLKDNWNELKEWLNEDVQRSADLHFQVLRKSDILQKMEELNKGDSNE